MDKKQLILRIVHLIEEKKEGNDCDESGSTDIKAFLRLMQEEFSEGIEYKNHTQMNLLTEIRLYFPLEFGEVLEEFEEKGILSLLSVFERVTRVLEEDEDAESVYTNEDFIYLDDNFIANARMATEEEKRLVILASIADSEEVEKRLFDKQMDDDDKIDTFLQLKKSTCFVVELTTGYKVAGQMFFHGAKNKINKKVTIDFGIDFYAITLDNKKVYSLVNCEIIPSNLKDLEKRYDLSYEVK